jgi:N-carbamoyl-L-amino-acid hydrolase
MAGLLEPEDLAAVDDEGVPLSVRMADIGGDLGRIEEARRRPGELAAYFELHIEQGPSLHHSNIPIGVVTGITGRAVFGVEIRGTANHAGTTPMTARHDALVSASKLALAVNRIAGEMEICRVATTGTLQVHPNAVNVVPGQVNLGVEFRDMDMNALSGAEVVLRRTAAEISREDGVNVDIQPLESTPSVPISGGMQQMVSQAAEQGGFGHERLPSGAGHDAQALAAITNAAMIFVPSVDGVSHSPEEYSSPQDCANGAQTLLNLLLLADESI